MGDRLAVLDMAVREARRAVLRTRKYRAEAKKIYKSLVAPAKNAYAVRSEAKAGQLLRRYEGASKTLAMWEERVVECEARLYQAEAQREAYESWTVRAQYVRERLLQQYGAGGYQYELLIDRLTEAVIRAEQLGLTPGMERERTAIVKEVAALIQALQKYTESRQHEDVQRQVRETVRAAIKELEAEIMPVAPTAWEAGLARIRAKLAG